MSVYGLACYVCKVKINRYDEAINCGTCAGKSHLGCVNMDISEYLAMCNNRTVKNWKCSDCTSPPAAAIIDGNDNTNSDGVEHGNSKSDDEERENIEHSEKDGQNKQNIHTVQKEVTNTELKIGASNSKMDASIDCTTSYLKQILERLPITNKPCLCMTSIDKLITENSKIKDTVRAQSAVIQSLRDELSAQLKSINNRLDICNGFKKTKRYAEDHKMSNKSPGSSDKTLRSTSSVPPPPPLQVPAIPSPRTTAAASATLRTKRIGESEKAAAENEIANPKRNTSNRAGLSVTGLPRSSENTNTFASSTRSSRQQQSLETPDHRTDTTDYLRQQTQQQPSISTQHDDDLMSAPSSNKDIDMNAPASRGKHDAYIIDNNAERSESDSPDSEEFKIVTYKRQRKHNNHKKSILIGSSDEVSEFKAVIVKRKRWFHVSRIPLDVNEDEMKEFMGGKLNLQEPVCVKIVPRNAERPTFNSFKVGIDADDVDAFLLPDKWPRGILISPWYFLPVRNTAQNSE